MYKPGKLFIISGPSGVGKTTLTNKALSFHSPEIISRVVTYTTRAPRAGDIAGVDYHFISPEDFKRKIDEGFFIEWSGAYQHYYGSAWHSIKGLEQGKSCIMILDRQGAQQVLSQVQATTIAILPPSLEVLEQRLQARATESATDIAKRLSLARLEIEAEKLDRLYTYYVVNTFFDVTLKNLTEIIASELQIIASFEAINPTIL